jgi:hypothetical protein
LAVGSGRVECWVIEYLEPSLALGDRIQRVESVSGRARCPAINDKGEVAMMKIKSLSVARARRFVYLGMQRPSAAKRGEERLCGSQ